MIKTDYNQAPPTLGVTNANTLRPSVALGAPGLTTLGTAQSSGFMNYNGLLVKFVRRFANGFSFFNSYTYGRAVDITSDNDGTVTLTNIFNPTYNSGPADYDIHHTISSNFIYELPIARGNKVAGGWQMASIVYWRTGLPTTITQSQGVLSTGTGNRPNLTGQDLYNSDKTIDHWWNPAAFTAVTETTATYGNAGRGIGRQPGQFNVDASLIKNTKLGKTNLELRIEAFNLFNHPQFAGPNTTFGNAAFGTISAMLSNPACSLCGTTERNVQLSAKLSF
jgi:hypothetical protein